MVVGSSEEEGLNIRKPQTLTDYSSTFRFEDQRKRRGSVFRKDTLNEGLKLLLMRTRGVTYDELIGYTYIFIVYLNSLTPSGGPGFTQLR